MIKKLLAKELRMLADRIDAGGSEISEDDALEIMDSIANVSMSQEESARYLNMNPRTFRYKVSNGGIPKGHKRRGITDKLWFLHELKSLIRR